MYFGRSLGSEWGRFFPLFSLFFLFLFLFLFFFPLFFFQFVENQKIIRMGRAGKKEELE